MEDIKSYCCYYILAHRILGLVRYPLFSCGGLCIGSLLRNENLLYPQQLYLNFPAEEGGFHLGDK